MTLVLAQDTILSTLVHATVTQWVDWQQYPPARTRRSVAAAASYPQPTNETGHGLLDYYARSLCVANKVALLRLALLCSRSYRIRRKIWWLPVILLVNTNRPAFITAIFPLIHKFPRAALILNVCGVKKNLHDNPWYPKAKLSLLQRPMYCVPSCQSQMIFYQILVDRRDPG